MNVLTRSLTSYNIQISSHSEIRAKERSVSIDAAMTIGQLLAKNLQESGDIRTSKIAIRSLIDHTILIFGVNSSTNSGNFSLLLITVWNRNDGEFFHHRNDIVIDFNLTKQGPEFTNADEKTVRRNKRN